MPQRPPRPCSRCGAPAIEGGKCAKHKAQQHARTDQRRGNATERGYASSGHRDRFRAAVLNRDDWTCVDCGGYGNHADHDPYERRELVEMGEDPDDPRWGITRCHSCHSRKTMKTVGRGNLSRPTDR